MRCIHMNLQILEKVSLNSLFTFGATIALMLHPVVLSQATTIRMYMMLVALIFVLMLKAIKQKYRGIDLDQLRKRKELRKMQIAHG